MASTIASTRITAASSSRARSSAGPTVLVWTTWQDAGNVVAALEERCAGWAEVRRLPFSPLGADVPEL